MSADKKYIVWAKRRHNKYQYFAGWGFNNTPIIAFERSKAKELSENEANTIVAFLSGPYTRFEKSEVN